VPRRREIKKVIEGKLGIIKVLNKEAY